MNKNVEAKELKITPALEAILKCFKGDSNAKRSYIRHYNKDVLGIEVEETKQNNNVQEVQVDLEKYPVLRQILKNVNSETAKTKIISHYLDVISGKADDLEI